MTKICCQATDAAVNEKLKETINELENHRYEASLWNWAQLNRLLVLQLKQLLELVIFFESNSIAISLQFVLSIVLGQSLSSMWSIVNWLQILHYLAMMTLFFPKIIMLAFGFLSIANMDNQLLSTLYQLHFDSSLVENRTSWDYRFENQGVESTNILMNCSDVFATIVLFLLFQFLCFTLACWFKRINEDEGK